MPTPPAPLSRREREILHVLFAFGERATADDVRRHLSQPPSYSAVRAMLAKLEAKGQVRHRAEGLRYVYFPVTPRNTARRTALHEVVQVFFGGSPAATAAALLTTENWTDAELDALSREIDRIREQRRA